MTELARLTVALDARIDQFERKVAQAEKRLSRTSGHVRQQGRQIDTEFSRLGAGLARIAGPVAAIEGMRRLAAATVRAGEQVRQLEGRFRALTGSRERAGGLLAGTFSAASGTGADLASVGQLVAQFRLATNQIGATDEEVVKFSENLIKLGVVGGASTTEISNGLRQLSQGLAGGVLRAEEFNSVIENTPMVAQALADALTGGSLGALREMVLAGRVLSEDVFRAILGQSEQINRQFAEMPMTIERATNNFGTAMTALLAQLDDATGMSAFIADAFERAAAAVNALTDLVANAPGSPSRVAREIEELGRPYRRPEAGSPSTPVPSAGGGRRGGSAGRRADPFDATRNQMRDRERQAVYEQRAAELEANAALSQREREELLMVERAVMDLRVAYERLAEETGRPVQAVTPAQIAEIELYAFGVAEAEEATRRMRDAQEAAARAAREQAAAIGALEDRLIGAISQARSFRGAMESVARILLETGLQGLLTGRGALGGLGTSIFGAGGAGGAIRGLFNSTSGTPITAGVLPTLNANGNAFRGGNVIPFATGGVIGGPTTFPMAGGRTGLMGEAGPEAIMPLRRGPGGRLGVEMTGGGASVRIMLDPGLRAEIVGEARGQTVEIVQAATRGPQFAARVAAASRDANNSRMR